MTEELEQNDFVLSHRGQTVRRQISSLYVCPPGVVELLLIDEELLVLVTLPDELEEDEAADIFELSVDLRLLVDFCLFCCCDVCFTVGTVIKVAIVVIVLFVCIEFVPFEETATSEVSSTLEHSSFNISSPELEIVVLANAPVDVVVVVIIGDSKSFPLLTIEHANG